MAWFFNTLSGALVGASGISALVYEAVPSYHKLKVPDSATRAQAAADAAKEFPAAPPATDSPATAASQLPAGATANASGVNFSSIQNALTAFYDKVTDGKMWRSLGWLLLGVLLIITGLVLWIGPGALKASPYGRALGAVRGAG